MSIHSNAGTILPPGFMSSYLDTLGLVERLHRLLLDVIKDEFERLGLLDINAVQALLLFNIGDNEVTAGELKSRGYYQGSNVSYNLKKLVETGYMHHQRCEIDRRAVRVRLTEKGRHVREVVGDLFKRHSDGMETRQVLDLAGIEDVNGSLRRLERFWSDQNPLHLLTAGPGSGRGSAPPRGLGRGQGRAAARIAPADREPFELAQELAPHGVLEVLVAQRRLDEGAGAADHLRGEVGRERRDLRLPDVAVDARVDAHRERVDRHPAELRHPPDVRGPRHGVRAPVARQVERPARALGPLGEETRAVEHRLPDRRGGVRRRPRGGPQRARHAAERLGPVDGRPGDEQAARARPAPLENGEMDRKLGDVEQRGADLCALERRREPAELERVFPRIDRARHVEPQRQRLPALGRGTGRPGGQTRRRRPREGPCEGSREGPRGPHQCPVFSMLAQGSSGALASPRCKSSTDTLSGERTKAMCPSRGGRLMVTPFSWRCLQVA